MNCFEKSKPEIGVEIPFMEANEVAKRLVEKAHNKEINPDNVGIISHNMSAEIAKALEAAEANPEKGVAYAVDLACQLKEHVALSNEYFPDDADKNGLVKEASLEYIDKYLEVKGCRKAA